MNHETQHSTGTPNSVEKTKLRIRFVDAVSVEFPVRQLEPGPLRMEQTEARPFISTARALQQL